MLRNISRPFIVSHYRKSSSLSRHRGKNIRSVPHHSNNEFMGLNQSLRDDSGTTHDRYTSGIHMLLIKICKLKLLANNQRDGTGDFNCLSWRNKDAPTKNNKTPPEIDIFNIDLIFLRRDMIYHFRITRSRIDKFRAHTTSHSI